MKIILNILILINTIQCSLHYYKLNDSKVILQNIPPNLDKNVTKIKLNRIPISEVTKNNDYEVHKSYSSPSLSTLLEKSGLFELENQAVLRLNYSVKTKTEIEYYSSLFFWFLTLGIIPVIEETDAIANFEFVDEKSSEILKQYKFQVSQTSYHGWLALLVAPILANKDNFSYGFLFMGNYPQEIIANRFIRDYYNDLKKDNQFLTKTKNLNSIREKKYVENYAILPVNYNDSTHKEISKVIRNKLETLFVNKQYSVVDRSKFDEILKEFKYSQTGLTKSDQIKMGEMLQASNFIVSEIIEVDKRDESIYLSIKNIQIESGKIIWKKEFLLKENEITSSIDFALDDLGKSIK